MPQISKPQLTLDFEPSLLHQFKTLRQVIAATVYSYRGGLGACAAACDTSPSQLSKALSDDPSRNEGRNLPVEWFDAILTETGDFRPLYWLCARHLQDDDTKQRATVDMLAGMLPVIHDLLASMKQAK